MRKKRPHIVLRRIYHLHLQIYLRIFHLIQSETHVIRSIISLSMVSGSIRQIRFVIMSIMSLLLTVISLHGDRRMHTNQHMNECLLFQVNHDHPISFLFLRGYIKKYSLKLLLLHPKMDKNGLARYNFPMIFHNPVFVSLLESHDNIAFLMIV